MPSFDRCLEKSGCGFGVSFGAKEKIDNVSFFIDSAIQIFPFAFHLNVSIISLSGISCCFEMFATAFIDLMGICYHPAIDCRIRNS